MAKKKIKKRRIKRQTSTRKRSLALPIISLILNCLFWPGLGSLVGGKTKIGIWQFAIAIIGGIIGGIYLFGANVNILFGIIGFPILAAAWIWGIVTGVQMIQEAK